MSDFIELILKGMMNCTLSGFIFGRNNVKTLINPSATRKYPLFGSLYK